MPFLPRDEPAAGNWQVVEGTGKEALVASARMPDGGANESIRYALVPPFTGPDVSLEDGERFLVAWDCIAVQAPPGTNVQLKYGVKFGKPTSEALQVSYQGSHGFSPPSVHTSPFTLFPFPFSLTHRAPRFL